MVYKLHKLYSTDRCDLYDETDELTKNWVFASLQYSWYLLIITLRIKWSLPGNLYRRIIFRTNSPMITIIWIFWHVGNMFESGGFKWAFNPLQSFIFLLFFSFTVHGSLFNRLELTAFLFVKDYTNRFLRRPGFYFIWILDFMNIFISWLYVFERALLWWKFKYLLFFAVYF
jgi:hypothetical protein